MEGDYDFKIDSVRQDSNWNYRLDQEMHFTTKL